MADKKKKRSIVRPASFTLLTPENCLFVVSHTDLTGPTRRQQHQRAAQGKKEFVKLISRLTPPQKQKVGSFHFNDSSAKSRSRSIQLSKRKTKRNIKPNKNELSIKKVLSDIPTKCSAKSKSNKVPKQKLGLKQSDRVPSSTKTKLIGTCLEKAIVPIKMKNQRFDRSPTQNKGKDTVLDKSLALPKGKDIKLVTKPSSIKTKESLLDKKSSLKSNVQLQRFPSITRLNLQTKPSPTRVSLQGKPSPLALLQKKHSPTINNRSNKLTKKNSPTRAKDSHLQGSVPMKLRSTTLKKVKSPNKERPSAEKAGARLVLTNTPTRQAFPSFDDHPRAQLSLEYTFDATNSSCKEHIVTVEQSMGKQIRIKSMQKMHRKQTPGTRPQMLGDPKSPLRRAMNLPTAGREASSSSMGPNHLSISNTAATRQKTSKPSQLERQLTRNVALKKCNTTHIFPSEISLKPNSSSPVVKKQSKTSGILSNFSGETVAPKSPKRSSLKKASFTRKPTFDFSVQAKGNADKSIMKKRSTKDGAKSVFSNASVQTGSTIPQRNLSAQNIQSLKGKTNPSDHNTKEAPSNSSTSMYNMPSGHSTCSLSRLGFRRNVSQMSCSGLLPDSSKGTINVQGNESQSSTTHSDMTGETVIMKSTMGSQQMQSGSGEPYSKIDDPGKSSLTSCVSDTSRSTTSRKSDVSRRRAEAWAEAIRRMKRPQLNTSTSSSHTQSRNRIGSTRRGDRRDKSGSSRPLKKSSKAHSKKKSHELHYPITITPITPIAGTEPAVEDPILIGHTNVQLKSILKRGPPPTTFKIGLSEGYQEDNSWKVNKSKRAQNTVQAMIGTVREVRKCHSFWH